MLRRLAALLALFALMPAAAAPQGRTVTGDKFLSKLTPWADVTAYGARVTTDTDSTAAFTAAIAACRPLTLWTTYGSVNAAGGCTVYIPEGKFLITASLPYVSGMRFVGAGSGSYIYFVPTVAGSSLFVPSATLADGHSIVDVQFRDFMVWGWNANTLDGLHLDKTTNLVVDNVTIGGFNGAGISVSATGDGTQYYNRITGTTLVNNGTNLAIGYGGNAITITGGHLKYFAQTKWDGNPFPTPAYLATIYQAMGVTFTGTSFEGAPTTGLVHDQGGGTTYLGCYLENATDGGPAIVRDAAYDQYGVIHVSGVSGLGGKLLLYENWTRASEGTDVWGQAPPPDHGSGTPMLLPAIVNGSFDKGSYDWSLYGTSHATMTRDTATIFNSNASLKVVHDGSGSAHFLYQAIDLTPYAGQQVYLTAMVYWTADAPFVYADVGPGDHNRILQPIVDYGNGWQMWGTSINGAGGTTANLDFSFTSSTAGRTYYLTNVQLWQGGRPTVPAQQPETYRAAAAPTTGTWATGDIVVNASPGYAAPIQWECTSGGSPGTWIAVDPVTRQDATPGTAQTGHVNLTGTVRGGSLFGHSAAGDTFLTADSASGYTAQHRWSQAGTLRWAAYIADGGTGLTWYDTADRMTLWAGATGGIGASNFSTGTTGWRIGWDGAAEFRRMNADTMHVNVFTADLERALAGSEIIAKSVAKTFGAFTVGTSTQLVVESFEGYDTLAVFVDGDYVRLRNMSRSGGGLAVVDAFGTVALDTAYGASGYDAATHTQAYTWTYVSGTTPVYIPSGTLALDYGDAPGSGFHEISAADDGAGTSYPPYARVATWSSMTPYTQATRAQMGNLQAVTGTAEYGFWAGDATLGNNQYLLASGSNFELRGIDLKLFDGATNTIRMNPTVPSFAMGSTLPTGCTSGAGIWMGKAGSYYDFCVGDAAGGQLKWNGTTSTLTAAGWTIGATTLSSTVGSNTVTLDSGNGRITWDNGSFMKVTGTGFGGDGAGNATNQFIEWFGPHQASLNDCVESNAVMYLKVDGSAYFGGTLLVGQLVNSTTGTVLDNTNTADLGPYSSLGNAITISVSYSFHGQIHYTSAVGQRAAYDAVTKQSPSAQIVLSRSFNGGAFADVVTYTIANGNHREEPPIDGEEPGDYYQNMGGSFTYLDPCTSSCAVDREYKVRIVTPWTNVNSTVTENRITLVSIEAK